MCGVALVAIATLVLAARALVAERQTVDDVFIFLRYARNLAGRGEWAFDPGEHVEGTSSVAWTAVLSIGWRLGLRGVGGGKALSWALGALVPAACALTVRRALLLLLPSRPLVWALPAAALAFDADLASWSASGMDTPLWALACVACVAMADRGRLAAVALGALALVRPEAPLFAAFGVVALSRDRRHFLRLSAFALAPWLALTIARLVYFHDFVPNTFWAKMHGAPDATDYTGLGYVANALLRRPLLLLLLPALAFWRFGASPHLRLSIALLLASFVFAFVAGGDWMPNRRLLVVALPLAAIAAAHVAHARFAAAASVALLVEASLTFDHAVDQTWRDVEWLDQRVSHWRVAARPFRDPYALDWMPTHLMRAVAPYVAPGDTIAHVDVGEMPYVMADVAFVDGFGLVDRDEARLAFSPRDEDLRARVRESFFARAPAAAIAVIDERSGRAFSPAQEAVMHDARFAAGWREIDRVPTWGNHPAVTYVRKDRAAASGEVASARLGAWLKRVPDVAPAP